MSRGRERAKDTERGSVLILVAALLVGLLGIAAIVLDLGVVRLDRRIDRGATDSAATAAAAVLGNQNDVLAACEAAWGYVTANLDLGSPASPCSSTFPAGPCTAGTTLEASASVGGYEISIANPIPDGDASWLRAPLPGGGGTQATLSATDGAPCERVGLRVTRVREAVLGGVLGSDSQQSTVHSVARAKISGSGGKLMPSMVALDPTGCPAVFGGSGRIDALAIGNVPGRIYVDSDASGAGCGTVFGNNPPGTVRALPGADGTPGELGYYAAPAKAFGAGSYVGTATPLAEPTTRDPADRRYHCSVAVEPCATSQDAMADLITRYTGTGQPAFPGVWGRVPGNGFTCSSPPAVFGAGHWYINCPNWTASSTFEGGGVIVFQGDITGGNTTINPSASSDTVVVVRGNVGVSLDGGESLTMRRTMLFNKAGAIRQAGNSTLTWTAPEAGPFKDLLYWTESTVDHRFEGTPGFNLDGIMVLPNARFLVVGSAAVNGTSVQLWASRVAIEGGAELRIRPNPNRAISLKGAGSALIR